MKSPLSIVADLRCFALLLGFCLSQWAAMAVTLTVSPSTITNDYVGKIVLTIAGINAGQTVRVERYADVNGNGILDAGEASVQSFTVTDGQLPLIGGVRNLNVAGDEDGIANGQMRIEIPHPWVDDSLDSTAGNFIYRISDAASGFTPVTQKMTVLQKVLPQGVTGKVTASGVAQPYTFVALFAFNSSGAKLAYADASGNFRIYAEPGSYALTAFKDGYFVDITSTTVTISSNQFATANIALTPASVAVTGKVTDINTGVGIPGVFVSAQSTNKSIIISSFADFSGNYLMHVPPGVWRIRASESQLAQQGYLYPSDLTTNLTAASGINFSVPKATALIYGTLKTSAGNPLIGIDFGAEGQSGAYSAEGRSYPNDGNYCLGVAPGTWNVGPSSDDSGFKGYTSTHQTVTVIAGQAQQINFLAQQATTHIRGRAIDSTGAAVTNLSARIWPGNGGSSVAESTTGSDGSFDLLVSGGSWTLGFDNNGSASRGLVSPSKPLTVTDGVDQNGFTMVFQRVTGQISCLLTNNLGSPVSGINMYATVNINSTNYSVNVTTDSNGRCQMGVFNGTWQVGVSCNGSDSSSLSSQGYACVGNKSVTISGNNGVANFVVQPAGVFQISGSLTDTSGTPVAGINIYASANINGTTLNANATTDSNGRYQFNAQAGTWQVGVSCNGSDNSNLGPRGYECVGNQNVTISGGNGVANFVVKPVTTSSGPDLLAYAISKTQSFTQSGTGNATADSGTPFRFQASATASASGTISSANLIIPGGTLKTLPASSSGVKLSEDFSTAATVDAAYPIGTYTLSLNTVHDGNKLVQLSLPASTYPNAPHISNFAATQTIAPNTDFVLRWDPMTGGTTNDFIIVSVNNSTNSNTVFQTPDVWTSSGPDGTATSVTIPAGRLVAGQTYSANITFIKLPTRQISTAYPGVLSLVGFGSKTRFTIAASSTSDTTAPTLVSSSPANNAIGVALASTISFTFSEPMQSSYFLAWSTNINPITFVYSWSTDQKILTCTYPGGWPVGATISWTLNPSGSPANFKDLAGNSLASNVFGQFTTVGNPDVAFYYVSKQKSYFQSDPGGVALETAVPFQVWLGINQTSLGLVTSANVVLPSGASKPFPAGSTAKEIQVYEGFTNQAAFDSAYGSGNYVFVMNTEHEGTKVPLINLDLGALAYPPAPRISNYQAAQAINPTNSFLLQWDAFAGGSDSDEIWLRVFDSNGNQVFSTPYEFNAALHGTATSAAIPAGTLVAGKTYTGILIYLKTISINSSAYAGSFGIVDAGAKTAFAMSTIGGGTDVRIVLKSPVISGSLLTLTWSSVTGQSYQLQYKTNLNQSSWSLLTTVTAATSSASATDTISSGGQRYYRVTQGFGLQTMQGTWIGTKPGSTNAGWAYFTGNGAGVLTSFGVFNLNTPPGYYTVSPSGAVTFSVQGTQTNNGTAQFLDANTFLPQGGFTNIFDRGVRVDNLGYCSGNWTGSLTETNNSGGNGVYSFSLSVTSTGAVTFTSPTLGNGAGSIYALAINNGAVSGLFKTSLPSNNPYNQIRLSATMNGNLITGSFDTDGSIKGTVSLSRQ